MTQPVQEPTQGRQDQGQDFRTRQLFRRPTMSTAGYPMWNTPIIVNFAYLNAASNAIESSPGGAGSYAANDWTIDGTYPAGGYWKCTNDVTYVSWVVNLGPKGSVWGIRPLIAEGTNYGKLEVQFASLSWTNYYTGDPPYEIGQFTGLTGSAGNGYTGGQPVEGGNSFVTLDYIDCYAAADNVFRIESDYQKFRIAGDDGVLGTSFTSNIRGWYDWDGGSGLHRVKLVTNGQNASSTGYEMRLGGFALFRLDDQVLP